MSNQPPFLRKKRYASDLCALIAQCERNYARFLRIMPALETCDERHFLLDHKHQSITLRVTERCKYTTTTTVTHSTCLGTWVPEHQLTVRLYHDARVAEVLVYQHTRITEGCYRYPNKQMFHADEKAQLNQFLGEWLEHCLQRGMVKHDVIAPLTR